MHRKLALIILAPLLATACSDDDGQAQRVEAVDTETAVAALQAAPDAAAEAGSGRMEMTMAFEVDGQPFELTSTGAFTGTRMRMEMDFGGLLAAQMPGEELPDGLDEPMVIIADGATSYMRMPMLDAITGTSGWLSLSPEDLGVAGDSLGMGLGATNNPTQMMEALRGVSDDIEELGAEEVRGEPTTRYRVVVDLEKALAEVPDELKPQLEAQLGAMGGTLPMEVWLDGDGLVRRLSMDMVELLAQATADSGVAMDGGSMIMEIFDYGADIDVDLPAPADVTPFTDIMGALG